MTKKEFKKRWESNYSGGGIDFDDISNCAIKWGISSKPKTQKIDVILYKVLCAADTKDKEDYNPYEVEE